MEIDERKVAFIKKLIVITVILVIFYFIYNFLMQFYFGEYIKAIHLKDITEFTRDKEVKYSDIDSFKIESPEFNDAMLCKEIEVIPNTPYKITCMIKTEDVVAEKGEMEAGAQICISDTTEASETIIGTTDGWQKVELNFDSKNRNKVVIGFRLGGYSDNCQGTAWFSDFDLKQGLRSESTTWNFACFLFRNIDTIIDGKQVRVSMTNEDVNLLKENIARFKNSTEELSRDLMRVEYDIYEINEPITTLSYDDTNGYYVSAKDINHLIKDKVLSEEYDHVFVGVRFGDSNRDVDIMVKGWMGLGGMSYLGKGFSNIRMPSDRQNVIYQYYANYNTFPEEVFVHEFLHSLERTLIEHEYTIPALHDNEKYGYTNDEISGLNAWYKDYMRCNIQSGNELIGLDSIVYKLRPIQESNFEYTLDLDLGWTKDNLIDVIKNSLKILGTSINLEKENVTIESFGI